MSTFDQHDIAFGVEIGGYPSVFRVVDFHVDEELSTPFYMTATIACEPNKSIRPADLRHKPVNKEGVTIPTANENSENLNYAVVI